MSELKSAAVFKEMGKRIDADKVKKIGKKFMFNINPDSTGEGKSWLVDLSSGNGSISEASSTDKSDCAITIKDSDFVKLVNGKLNAQSAFMTGKLKIKGKRNYGRDMAESITLILTSYIIVYIVLLL